MTQIEFKAAMLRGLGRCVTAVKQEPEKYRQTVLWACKQDTAYDAQSEGTHSWYIYTLASTYPDKETFIQAAAEALKKYRPNGSWDLLFLSELLQFFAQDGFDSAWQAVEEKYREVLAAMFARKRRPNRVFHELADLEQLGLVLAVDRKTFLRVAKDFGRLYREKNYMEDGDFSWFFSEKGDQFKKTMERAAKKDEDVACFMQRELASIAAQEKLWEAKMANPQENLEGRRLSSWLAKQADRQTAQQYALAYREQSQPQLRAKALEAFVRYAYPDDPAPLMEDTGSPCEQLQNTAWQALENVRHSSVREFALRNAASGIHTPENFALLVTNYESQDAQLLEDILRQWIAAEDWDSVHGAGMDIYRAFYKGSGIPHPKHLLPLLYEYNPCSFCRESALEYMSRHRILTKEILEECLYDSNYDIRRMAKRRLR